MKSTNAEIPLQGNAESGRIMEEKCVVADVAGMVYLRDCLLVAYYVVRLLLDEFHQKVEDFIQNRVREVVESFIDDIGEMFRKDSKSPPSTVELLHYAIRFVALLSALFPMYAMSQEDKESLSKTVSDLEGLYDRLRRRHEQDIT